MTLLGVSSGLRGVKRPNRSGLAGRRSDAGRGGPIGLAGLVKSRPPRVEAVGFSV